MNIVNLFAAIYHENKKEIKKILIKYPELLEQKFKEEKKQGHTMTKTLYDLCENNRIIDDPNYREENALLFAARLGKKEICQFLIEEFKANINVTNIYGFNPLMNALHVHTDKNIDTAIMLLNNENINLKHKNAGKFNILGHFLRNWQHIYGGINPELSINKVQEMIDEILNKGFDINEPQGKSGETGFLLACGSHSWIVVIYLISKGADYSISNDYLYPNKNMYTYFCSNQYLKPAVKEELLGIIEKVIKDMGEPYGPYKKPDNLYVCPLTGDILEYDQERFG